MERSRAGLLRVGVGHGDVSSRGRTFVHHRGGDSAERAALSISMSFHRLLSQVISLPDSKGLTRQWPHSAVCLSLARRIRPSFN
jgi:hypothetical protein